MALGPVGQANGITPFFLTSSSGVTAPVSQIIGQPSHVCFISAGNTAGVARYLKIYDTANANSGAGMQAAFQFMIPGNAAGAGTNIMISPGPPQMGGLQLSTGLAVAITANAALADASGTQSDCFATIGWR